MVVLACLVFLLIASLLYLATKVRSQKFRFGKILRAASIFFFLLLTAFLHNNTRFNDQVYVSDTNTIAFVWRNVYNRLTGDNLGSAGLQSRNKPKLSNVSSKPAFNVLLIVAESLRKNNMSLYGYKKDTTPFLVRNVKNANHYSTFVFKQAFSNSSSTLLSFPSILSGVSPAQPVPMTHSFPLFWEYAKVLNYSTFYITSHDLQWNNFKGFFRNSSIDKIWDKEASGSGVFNDIGIDDRKTVEEFKRYVTFLKNKKEKFAGVLHFNTNHFPYIIPEEGKVFPVNTVPDQYDNSVRHMDNLLKEVYEFMESEGLTESTLVIFTSDHGESLFEHDYLGHIDSNHIETIAIPMIIRLPHALSKDGVRTEAIKRNTTRPVANTDIIPTMLDALDLEKKPDVKNYLPKLEGKSLLRDLDDERKIIVTNNNEISLYKVGISYLKGDLHYLMNLNTIPPREKLYDLSKDPNELRDLWPELSETEKEECRKELQECGLCRDLYESIGIRPMNSGATDSGKSRNKAVSVK